MKKIFKMTALVLLGLMLFFTLGIILFLYTSPVFGGKASPEQKLEYARTGYYQNGKFQNTIPTPMSPNLGNVIRERMKNNVQRNPEKELFFQRVDSLDIVEPAPGLTRLTWFGHSAFLLEIDDKNILLDPMLGQYAAPLPMLGPKRYNKELPIEIAKLPFIDAVIFSHDHYDHLDYGSIRELKEKVGTFFVPLGVDNHLRAWGVPDEKIQVLQWWDETTFEGIQLACTPSRHFSGRGLTDRAATLWCSWVIRGANHQIYFSGDSGYGPHFKEIGEKYGPFDIALMECGQYNEEWATIHMMPEETAQAAADVQGKLLLPIHWGAFTLALHSWTDPAERVTRKAEELGIPYTTPRIGQPVILGQELPRDRWWEHVGSHPR